MPDEVTILRDNAFDEGLISEVRAYEDTKDGPGGWEISWKPKTLSIGTLLCFLGKKDGMEHGIEPKVGMTIRIYGKFGRPIRGISIDGKVAYYRTPEQQKEKDKKDAEDQKEKMKADFAANKTALDTRFEALPEQFRLRILRYRENNPDFRWEFEKYELFCSEEAVRIADVVKTTDEFKRIRAEAKEIAEKEAEAKGRKKKDAYVDLGAALEKKGFKVSKDHSGNTFSTAVNLAYVYLENPLLIPKMHGALAALVGCDAYGCPPIKEDAHATG